jgi:hypothetical protein
MTQNIHSAFDTFQRLHPGRGQLRLYQIEQLQFGEQKLEIKALKLDNHSGDGGEREII